MNSSVTIDAYDIDGTMAALTTRMIQDQAFVAKVMHRDYLDHAREGMYTHAVLNPPYVRQEWITRKEEYRKLFLKRYGVVVPGTSNLYVYFLVKVIADLVAGGKFACIVYDSWQSTRFGKWLFEYLRSTCSDLRVDQVGSLPFDGYLIDATIISGTKALNPSGHSFAKVECADSPAALPGTARLDSLFKTERGLRLKQADFFMSDIDSVKYDGGKPFVKKSILIPGYVVSDSHRETVLLTTDNRDSKTRRELERRLLSAQENPEDNVSVLTWARERPLKWAQHSRSPKAPLIFNYYLRRTPKHIYNPTRIYSDNFYGLIPLGSVHPLAWLAALNCTASAIGILRECRNQGSGLAKVQLFEYRQANVVNLDVWPKRQVDKMQRLGQELASGHRTSSVLATIDELVAKTIRDERMHSANLQALLEDADLKARKPKQYREKP